MAQNGGTPELPEAVSKPPEGIVLPPKDIRGQHHFCKFSVRTTIADLEIAIVEKTAGYVARNGPVFEDRIRDKEQHNPKFSFLSPNDAYAPFYQWRLLEIRAGRGTAISAGRADGPAPVEEKPKGPAPPPDFQFSARMPNISALDLEVVKLTALHVARKGKSWMTALSQREARNYQFDFLRPQHSLYNFFSHLVDQYSVLLQTGPEGQKTEQARIQTLQANVQNKFRVLELAKQRAEYVKWQETQKQKKEEEEEAERIAYAQIDWHDFVVVETVLFTDTDEQADLPPPTSLNDLQSASLEQKAMMSLARPDMRIEEAMPTDDMMSFSQGYEDGYAQQNGYTLQPQQASAMDYIPTVPSPQTPYPSYSPAPPTPQPQSVPTHSSANATALPQRPDTASPHPQNLNNAPIKVRSDYVPRAQQRQRAAQTAICPNCGEQVLLSELDQHMRIELLDPRWKEQRAKADSRFASTNLGGTDVAANLKRLRARTGGDISDPIAESAARVLEQQEEEERRKRQKIDEQPAASGFAGAPPTVPPPGQTQPGKDMSLQEQINRIHQKFKT
jgi:splicing factor 3A subunit 1